MLPFSEMRKVLYLFLSALCVLPSTALSGDALVLSNSSYGAIRFGQKLSDASRQLGEKVRLQNGDESCDHVEFKRYPGVRFMVENGVITRASSDQPIPTSVGITIGTPLTEIRKRHPEARIIRYIEGCA